MNTEVDLRGLAIDRGESGQSHVTARRHMLTRYVLPLVLLLGFLSLVAWAARDIVFPPKAVTVVPVFSTRAEVREEGTPLFSAAGWIEPRPTPVRVAALAPGVVEQLLVIEDQAVKKGEPIAELVKDDAKLARDGALAALKLCEAEVDQAQAALTAALSRFEEPVHLQATLGEADASLAKIVTQLQNLPFATRRAEADLAAVHRDYEGKFAARAVIAGVEVDIAKSKVDSAQALVEELRDRAHSLEKEKTALTQRRDALKRQLKLLTDEIKARDEAQAETKAAEARAELAQVAVAEQELRLSRMTVRSPIDGRVFRLIGHPGARIGGGGGMTQMAGHDGSTIVTLYRPDMLQVSVDVRFEDIQKVSPNQPVEIDNPALAAPMMGIVLFKGSEADKQKNTLQVKVAIPDPPPVFKPEMLVDVTFLAPSRAERPNKPSEVLRFYVLQQLVLEDEAGSFVWLADQSASVARKTRVQAADVASNGLVEIISGLTVSSRIIVSGTDNLHDGDRIHVVREDDSLGTKRDPRTTGPQPTGDR